jgi:hypothetical protein
MIKPKRIAFDKAVIPAAIFDREKRPRRRNNAYAVGWLWLSRDGRYRVLCSQSLYGNGKQHYPPQWTALRACDCCLGQEVWSRLPGSPFRGPGPAFAAVKKAVEAEQPKREPPVRRRIKRTAGMVGAQGK